MNKVTNLKVSSIYLAKPTYQNGHLWLCYRLQKCSPWKLVSVCRNILLGSHNRQQHFHSFWMTLSIGCKRNVEDVTFWLATVFKTNINQQVLIHVEARSLEKDSKNKIAPISFEHDDLTITYNLGIIQGSLIVLKDNFIAFPLRLFSDICK